MVTFLRAASLILVALDAHAAAGELATAERGIIATGHPLATRAGLEAMKRGGNAVDAAVAAGLMLGVVDGSNSGIGGGCFILLRTPAGEYVAIDGRETAPQAATRDMFLRDGTADTRLSQVGALASGTPGALAAYELAARRYGKLPLSPALLAAAEVAAGGFEVGERYAERVSGAAEDFRQFPASRALFLKTDGSPLQKGDTLVQPDLAATYRHIAENGIAWFYSGPFAERVGKWMGENGGLLAADDFKNYHPTLREPVRSTYRDAEVISFPPPSSGGVHVLQLLNILEQFDLKKLGDRSADTIHVVTEAMRLAFADRAHWLGDPAFTPVPRGLVSKEYGRLLAETIRMEKAAASPTHGTPPQATEDVFGKHTTHFSAADADGNWVACTATINTSFGSKVVVPGTGVVLNNEMDDFAIQPGVPNAFGLVGGEANAVAPGKRPLSSMSPTIVTKDGEPILAVGAAGGPTIISQTLLAIIDTVDFEREVHTALAAPRFHHQWRPEELKIEQALGDVLLEALRARGHALAPVKAFGACHAVARAWGQKTFTGAADPRTGGEAAGW